MKLLLVLLCITCLSRVRSKNINLDKDNVLETIEQGSLIGRETKDWKNDAYFIFEAIPYAKPPVGALRFKAPEPAEPWTGIYNATHPRNACPQVPTRAVPYDVYDEDCLFVNVYTKLTDILKPVMVWIHGGAFEAGSINTKHQGSEWLMAEDIVLVDIQYRLNTFGFLSFDDPKYEIPGNAGFKDQILALKWIQKNIANFGGDPSQVTIFGESAGGASVHLLYVSPASKGLFHRVIAQSGSGANTWVYSLTKYQQLAEALNCTSSTLDETVKCINSSSTEEILDAGPIMQKDSNGTLVDGITISALTIEPKNSKDPFLTEPVDDIIAKGEFNKVPLIIGVCANESALYYNDRPFIGPNFTEAEYERLIPKDIIFENGSVEAFNIGKQIKEFYYGNQTPTNDLLDPWIKYVSDLMFIYDMYRAAKVQVATVPNVPVYFYNFNYRTSLNFEAETNLIEYVAHGDDLAYLFNFDGEEIRHFDPKSDEYIGLHRMVKLWTTFAKSKSADPNSYDDPLFNGVIWKPLTPENFNYLHIHPNLELLENLYQDRMNFWDELYTKYKE